MSTVEQIGKQVGGFMDIMRSQPLSLALVVMNFALVGFLFYSNAQTLGQRQNAMDQIVSWQKDTDKLMAGCVSQDVTRMMMDNIQKVTETMLNTAQKDIERMQHAVDKEREMTRQWMERMLPPAPKPPTSFTQPRPIDFPECDPLGPFCMPL